MEGDEDQDGGIQFGRQSVASSSVYSKRRSKSMRKYRRDNQTYCGTSVNQKCSIF